MAQNNKRYKTMERNMTFVLLADLLLFILFLIFAGNGIIWMKVVLIVLIFLISLGALAFLYLSNELLKKRSLWMGTAAAAIFICTLFSLILNFPAPAPM